MHTHCTYHIGERFIWKNRPSLWARDDQAATIRLECPWHPMCESQAFHCSMRYPKTVSREANRQAKSVQHALGLFDQAVPCRYAAFFSPCTFVPRARGAAAIFLRAADDTMRLGLTASA